MSNEKSEWQLYGELFIDRDGDAHFICHTKNDDFLATKTAVQKFIVLLTNQISGERKCPYYTESI